MIHSQELLNLVKTNNLDLKYQKILLLQRNYREFPPNKSSVFSTTLNFKISIFKNKFNTESPDY